MIDNYKTYDLPLIAFVRSFTTGYPYICRLEKSTGRYDLADKVRGDGWIQRLNQKVLDLRQNNLTALPFELADLDQVEEIRLANDKLENLRSVLVKMKGLKKILFANRTSWTPEDLR